MSKLKEDIVRELHRSARRNYPRRRIVIKGFDETWQADLADLSSHARENTGNKFILVVIDCFSKYLWTEPLKNKSAATVTEAMKKIFKKGLGRIPKNLQTDQGKEFYNTEFLKLMTKHGINHYSTYTVIKAAIAERVIRTIKEKLYRLFSLRGKYRWVDMLQTITREYNNRKHGTIKMRPIAVDRNTPLLKNVYSTIKIHEIPKFNVGDTVRISKQKAVFSKGYTPNWSTELFKIYEIKRCNPVVYMLEDMNGSRIKGAFYPQELLKTKHGDAYLVERVLKRKKDKLFVSWLGLDKSHNSWIDKKDME